MIEEHGQVITVAPVKRPDTLLPQIPHEQLQANESKHAETEDSEDHDIRQFLHRLNQGANDGFKTWNLQFNKILAEVLPNYTKNIHVKFWLQVSSIHFSCSHVKWHAVLTWNYSYCFQGPKNTESPQSWYIPQVHKLCEVPVDEVEMKLIICLFCLLF